MASDSSLGEALCLLNPFCEPHSTSSSVSDLNVPSVILSSRSLVRDQDPLITSPPELRLRNALPDSQQDSCQQAEQSASQAIQQASQQASQAIQRASQSADQAVRQATQQLSQSAAAASHSASQAIQQAQQSASRSIADAQRSVSSALQALASVQSSAADAISRANGQRQSARIGASNAQVSLDNSLERDGTSWQVRSSATSNLSQILVCRQRSDHSRFSNCKRPTISRRSWGICQQTPLNGSSDVLVGSDGFPSSTSRSPSLSLTITITSRDCNTSGVSHCWKCNCIRLSHHSCILPHHATQKDCKAEVAGPTVPQSRFLS